MITATRLPCPALAQERGLTKRVPAQEPGSAAPTMWLAAHVPMCNCGMQLIWSREQPMISLSSLQSLTGSHMINEHSALLIRSRQNVSVA